MKCVFFILCLLGFGGLVSRADVVVSLIHPQVDSAVVFKFKAKSNVFMPAMFGNDKSMKQLKAWTDRYRTELDAGKCHLSVESFCHDFDVPLENQKVAKERSLYVKGYLIKELRLQEKYFQTRNLPVESYYKVGQGGVVEKKEIQEKDLELEIQRAMMQASKGIRDTVVVHDTIYRQVVKEVVREVPVEMEAEIKEVIREVKPRRVAERGGLHLKTDLLGWLLLTPNAGAEYLINDHWSVGGDVRWRPWGQDDKCDRLILGGAEVRYYFGDESPVRGAFAGIFYEGGKFNYKPKATGYQGNTHCGGAMMGYALPLNRSLFLEFVLGAGFSHASYDLYERMSGEDVEMGHDTHNAWRLSKVQITLGWKIK